MDIFVKVTGKKTERDSDTECLYPCFLMIQTHLTAAGRPQGRPQLSPLPGGCGQLQAVPDGLWQRLQHSPPQVLS